MTRPLEQWKGTFGDEYTARNSAEVWLTGEKRASAVAVWERMLREVWPGLSSIMEIGANIGLNLGILRELLPYTPLYAIEPNYVAWMTLVDRYAGLTAWNEAVEEWEPKEGTFDLVFTSGVLIHIPPENLLAATDKIVRAAGRYVLCKEYFDVKPTMIPYHGQDNLLFKRDFGSWYLDHYPELHCIDYGFWWSRLEPYCDNSTWWLFEKGAR